MSLCTAQHQRVCLQCRQQQHRRCLLLGVNGGSAGCQAGNQGSGWSWRRLCWCHGAVGGGLTAIQQGTERPQARLFCCCGLLNGHQRQWPCETPIGCSLPRWCSWVRSAPASATTHCRGGSCCGLVLLSGFEQGATRSMLANLTPMHAWLQAACSGWRSGDHTGLSNSIIPCWCQCCWSSWDAHNLSEGGRGGKAAAFGAVC
jgi:hypothetical protein